MNYATLIAPKSTPGSLASWANYGLAPAVDVLADAQSLLFLTLRVREMMTDLTPIALASGESSAPLPLGFLDPLTLRNAAGQQLAHKDVNGLLNRRTFNSAGVLSSGQPGVYAIFGERLQFDAAASAATTLQMVYFKKPANLSDTVQNNFLTDRYPNLLRTACLAVAADFRKHTEDYNRNVQRLTTLIEQINRENELYLRGVEVDADYRSL